MKNGDYDRTARLLHVLYILNHNPKGITPAKIAERCGVTTRTTYRDLRELEDWEHLNLPIIWEGGNVRIEPGQVLPPIFFRIPEAMAIFLASRLLYVFGYYSTWEKLNETLKRYHTSKRAL